MSNRDGKNAKRRSSDRISLAKAGDPCPMCTRKANARKKTKRKIRFDEDGHAKYVHRKISKLSKAYCAKREGHESHVHCRGCNFTNF